MAFAQREEDQPLPPKVGNQGTTKSAQQVNVLLNSYQMDIKQMVPQVFQYELRFVGERTIQKKDGQQETKVVDFASGPRNDVSKETRRRLIWQLYQQLLNQHADFFGQEKRNFTFDCALLLFSIKQLPLEANEQRKFPMALDRANLEDRCSDHIRRTETVTATISHTGVVNLRDAAAAYISGDRSVVQFLELLSSQRIYEQGDHLCFGNRMYEQDSVIQLQGDPRILKSGLQKNVRFVGDNVQNAQPILQIDPKKSAFQPAVELLNFLVNFLGLQNAEQYEQNPDRYYARANKQVRGLVLATTHLPEGQIQFSALKLTDRPAAEATFRQQGQQVRVIDYLQQKYALRIRYPGLPCAIHRKPGQQGQNEPNDSLYPIELLTILPGQRVPIDKQTPKLTEQMIRQCQVLPIQLGPQIDQQRDKAMVQSGNPFFKQHGLRVDPNQMRTEAQVLFPPAIQYNPPNDRVEPDRTGKLEWRTVGREVPQRRAYTACATWPTRWAVVIVQNSIPQNPCQQFCRELVNTAQKRGIGDADMPQRVDHFEDNTLEFVRDKFEFYRNYKCTFVLCFAPGKRDAKPGDIHQVLKYCEQQYNVLTLHVSPEIAQKGTSQGGGAAMVLENILMKLNLKLGGANFNLVTSTAYKQASRSQADVCADVWLSGKRMFIGIDFSHAPPLSMHDRQANKIPSIPSLVGMAYTVDKAMLRMRGTYWCQQTRQTTMVADHQRPFIDHIKEALSLYIATNDQFPEHLIVFRAGISEGEFQRISFWEGQAFCAAFEEVAKQYGGKFTSPAVTIVVCQRRSNYRMIPERITGQKAPEQNVMPGTVLDKRAMSAACTDFLLIPHKALQGTAQPTRCTVVHEWRPTSGPAARIPPQMAVEELENITNALCYSHGICAMSTALPGVLYAAGELAKRGRNNWKMHTEDGTRNTPHFDLPAQGQEGDAAMQAQMDLDRQRAQHNAEMTGELRPILPTKFWA